MTRYQMSGSGLFHSAGQRGRVGFLDETRGFCIILMVLYHTLYSVAFIFGWDIPLAGGAGLLYTLYYMPAMRFAQPFVAGIFIFISGVACRYSRSNLKRGVIVLALGLVVTLVTVYFIPDHAIYFGILHFLGTAMIVFGLLNRALDKLAPSLGFLFCLVLFFLTLSVRWGYVGVPGLWRVYFPGAWTEIRWLIPLGFTLGGADHFPLLPWLFLFLAGSFLGIAFTRREMPSFFYRNRSRFLAAAGRRTIYIYLLHQPVVFGILFGVNFLVGRLGG